jgi:hypothetical protein
LNFLSNPVANGETTCRWIRWQKWPNNGFNDFNDFWVIDDIYELLGRIAWHVIWNDEKWGKVAKSRF